MAELQRLRTIRTILARNEYPALVIECTLKRFMEKKSRVVGSNEKGENSRPTKRFLKLPYVSRKCEDYAFRLKKLVETHYEQVEFNVAFQAPMTIGSMFPFKDRVENVEERSMVVYCLQCNTCGDEYIGKTERILCHRLKEHRENVASACHLHVKANKGHLIGFDKVKVLDTATTDTKLRVKELLHILNRKPELNKQLGSQSSYEINTLLIKAYPQFQQQK